MELERRYLEVTLHGNGAHGAYAGLTTAFSVCSI